MWVSWWTLGKRLILCFLQIYDFFCYLRLWIVHILCCVENIWVYDMLLKFFFFCLGYYRLFELLDEIICVVLEVYDLLIYLWGLWLIAKFGHECVFVLNFLPLLSQFLFLFFYFWFINCVECIWLGNQFENSNLSLCVLYWCRMTVCGVTWNGSISEGLVVVFSIRKSTCNRLFLW